jgi:hypothetical protein
MVCFLMPSILASPKLTISRNFKGHFRLIIKHIAWVLFATSSEVEIERNMAHEVVVNF